MTYMNMRIAGSGINLTPKLEAFEGGGEFEIKVTTAQEQ